MLVLPSAVERKGNMQLCGLHIVVLSRAYFKVQKLLPMAVFLNCNDVLTLRQNDNCKNWNEAFDLDEFKMTRKREQERHEGLTDNFSTLWDLFIQWCPKDPDLIYIYLCLLLLVS